jgi:hypothetical protein
MRAPWDEASCKKCGKLVHDWSGYFELIDWKAITPQVQQITISWKICDRDAD